MKRTAIIVHGWADTPTTGWINWLADKLTRQGYEVIAPQMPSPAAPRIKHWVAEIERATDGKLNRRTVLIGHSLGCFALLRFLEARPKSLRVNKLILVAGFSVPREKKFIKYFLPEPDYSKIIKQTKHIYCVYSDNDKVVPPKASQALSRALRGTTVLDKGKGHFIGRFDCRQLPSVLRLVTKPETLFGRVIYRIKKTLQ